MHVFANMEIFRENVTLRHISDICFAGPQILLRAGSVRTLERESVRM